MRTRLGLVVVVLCAVYAIWAWQKQAQINRGHETFTRLGCPTCHFNGGGPDLRGVTKKYDHNTIVRFIQNPNTIYAERGHGPLNEGWMMMPNMHATSDDANAIYHYLHSMTK